MNKLKRVGALALACLMCFTLGACKKKAVSYEKVAKDDPSSYTIAVCMDASNDYYSTINSGFTDAIDELFGSDRITFKEFIIDDDVTIDEADSFIKNSDADIIFTMGKRSLKAAKYSTSDRPIVACDIMDYQRLLDLQIDSEGKVTSDLEQSKASKDTPKEVVEWDQLTGNNITGVSSLPNSSSILSLIIESTKDLQKVGLIYVASDDDSAMQIKQLKEYMDQAKIAYNEYPIEANASASIIRSTASKACSECSCIYIPSSSQLTNDIGAITNQANAANIPTIGGDATLGQYTLTSLFYDSYTQGYQSAKLVYRILRNNEKPSEIKIQALSDETIQKLYNKEVASKLGLSFPKSFEEINQFKKDYQPGDKVTKLDLTSKDD